MPDDLAALVGKLECMSQQYLAINLRRDAELFSAAATLTQQAEEIAKLQKLLLRLIPLAAKTTVVHHKKTLHKSVEVDGELEHWSVDGGCVDNCVGCAAEQERDEVVPLARKLSEEIK